jgi:hypothetical protein
VKAKQPTPQTARHNPGEDSTTANHPQSDWARIPAAQAIVSVSRSLLYVNFDISGGAIKTASIRRRGATRGIRMVHVPSLLAWQNSYAEPSTSLDATGGGGQHAAPTSNLNSTQA